MNKVVTYGLIFVGGAAVGGGIGWFVTKKHYEKTMDETIEKEVVATKEFYQHLAREGAFESDSEVVSVWQMRDADSGPEPESVTTTASNVEEVGRQAVESYTDRMNRRKADLLRPERVRYDTFSKPTKTEEEEVDEVRLAQNDDSPRTDIYVINADQFAHERYGFDKVTLYWWELERILSEEDMDILDVPGLLGTGWEAHIGEEEKDIVYVRNEPLETDYEVVVQHESFYAMRD